jgi:hypothetical protein
MRIPLTIAVAALVVACAGKEDEPVLAQPAENGGAPAEPGGGEPSAEASDSAAAAAESAEPALARPGAPVVDLGGVSNIPAPIPEGAPRLAARDLIVRVLRAPNVDSKTLGFLRAGAVVAAAGTEVLAPSKKCKKGWRELAPAGFVCLDEMTEDLADPIVRATSRRPDPSQRLPYMYGTVTRGGPVYARIPTQAQLKRHEPGLKEHLRKWKDDEESGATYGLDVWLRHTTGRDTPSALEALEAGVTDSDLPFFLVDGKAAPNLSGLIRDDDAVKIDQVDRRQGRSFIYSFLFEGRRYNVTPDLVVIPADRFRPIRGSAFHGWQVDKELEFPFALIRKKGARKWMWQDKTDRMVDGGQLEWRSAVRLTGKQKIYDGKLHYQATDGFWVDDRHASRVDPAKKWPKWAQQGGKWIDVNITKQVLVAYEGTKMVFATLVSSGEDGLGEPEEGTATKRGIFRIHTKHVTTTMDSEVVGEEFELRDVPYVQYFEGGYAIHGAYWHDDFGRPKSHGCINLAPEDARRLFYWTDPPVPDGWHGVSVSLTGTIVFVHP